MHPLETYLTELRNIHSSGASTPETAYYPALANLLNEIGKTIKPRVRCIMGLKDQGAGMPDGGLFTADQVKASEASGQLKAGTTSKVWPLPARGVIEVKGTGEDVGKISESKQVTKYLEKYGQVLVTNLRDFILVGQDDQGRLVKLESFGLAESEAAFWAAAAHPRRLAQEHGERFSEYLLRVLLHAAPLSSPADVAWFLASYARDARARVEQSDLPALESIRAALEEALGVTFEGRKGEHFFRSTLVQTLFYGVFSAWVLWHTENPDRTDEFHWQMSADYLHVPVLQVIFEQAAAPSKVKEMGLRDALDWTGVVLNRIDRAAFFSRFEKEHAVQYFYEPFLQAFDPELRKELGVWYTPPEIVEYMVARVDTVLREELDRPDGLADPDVYVLDPCCGTGTYLVEVLRRIGLTLRDKGGDALVASDLKRAAMERVFGFEILPAPFVIAHLQLGLLLQNLGAPLADSKSERAAVYLTNALTGWEPPTEPKTHFMFPELEQERDAAERIKQNVPILVILGNPPYNGFAGVAVDEERDLSNAYRTTKRAPAPQGQGLNDLYVRFFRMAERRIVERTGQGVVCFVSNYSWLDGLSFTGMREHYLDVFDRIWIDCLNGDKYKTGKLTPEGDPDPSVFSTEFNPEGIQVGTAVALLVRHARPTLKHRAESAKGDKSPWPSRLQPTLPSQLGDSSPGGMRFRHLWGKTKRADLLATAAQDGETLYQKLDPPLGLGLPFMPSLFNRDYLSWPLLPELFPVSFPGVKTSRDDALVDVDRDRLVARMQKYFDSKVSHEEVRRVAPSLMSSTARFNAKAVREQLCKRGFLPKNVVRYCYRPFDVRWLYWEPETKLLDEKRSEYFPHVFEGNKFLLTTGRTRKNIIEPALFTQLLNDLNCMDSGARGFPLCVRSDLTSVSLFDSDDARKPTPNLSEQAAAYLNRPDRSARPVRSTEADLFYHVIAILHSPTYRRENSGALRQDWPRIPLPSRPDALLASAALGRQIAALLDTEHPVKGVTSGTIRPELKSIAVISRVGGGALQPDAGELAVTAGWGHAGKGGVTMPGKGKVVTRPEGPETCDVYLNGVAYWKNIPARVWEYTIGGYQVIKKWLSYRERDLLGRSLTPDEAREVTNMARRIAAILLLEPELDKNYQAIKQSAYAWTKGAR